MNPKRKMSYPQSLAAQKGLDAARAARKRQADAKSGRFTTVSDQEMAAVMDRRKARDVLIADWRAGLMSDTEFEDAMVSAFEAAS